MVLEIVQTAIAIFAALVALRADYRISTLTSRIELRDRLFRDDGK